MRRYTQSYVSKNFNGGLAAITPKPFPGKNPLRIYWWTPDGTHIGKFTSAIFKQYKALKNRHKFFVIFDKGGKVLSGTNNTGANLTVGRSEVFSRYFARPNLPRTGFYQTLSALKIQKVGKLFTFIYPDDFVRGGMYEPFLMKTWLAEVNRNFPPVPKTKPAPRNV